MQSTLSVSEFTQSLFTLLHCGNGVEDILALAEKQLRKPISIYDINYNLIAVSPQAKNVYTHLTKNNNRFFLNENNTIRMQQNNILNEINQRKSAYVAKAGDVPEQYWLLCAIRIKNSFVGYLIAPTDNNVSNEELEIVTQLSYAVSIELQKSNILSYESEFKYTYFMNNLLEGNFENEAIIDSRLKILSKDVYNYKRVLCISYKDITNPEDFNPSLVNKARSFFQNCISTTYENNLVLLISQNTSCFEKVDDFTRFIQFLETHKLYACISPEYSNMMDTSFCYNSARTALEIALKTNSVTPLFYAEDLLFYQLLHFVDRNRLYDFSYSIYEQIKEFDKINHTDFILTIRTYLENDRNSTMAAQVLHVHRTTFFYRLKRMEELWNISFSDCKILFLFEVAIRIEDYLSLH